MNTLNIQSSSQFGLVDITSQINGAIDIDSGLCVVFAPHTTAGVICNENEPNLKQDILGLLKEFKDSRNFKHDPGEGNAHAHIINSLASGARVFIVENGQLHLGTWQSVMFLEMDGPRKRAVCIKTVSDK